MFCFQSPFGKRERDKTLPRNFLSESDKDLNKPDCKPYLCLSDPNITDVKKWERWRTNAQIGYHMDMLKNKKTQDKKLIVENSYKRKNSDDEIQENNTNLFQLLSENIKTKALVSEEKDPNENSSSLFQAQDIAFIDEQDNGSINTSQETEDKKDCVDVAGINKSEPSLEKSIIRSKAINNSSELEDCIIRSESEQNVTNRVCDLEDSSNAKALDTNSQKIYKTSKKLEKNSGSLFLSFCSLFNLSKSPENVCKVYSRNNEIKFAEQESPILIQQNIISSNLSCCPLSSPQIQHMPMEPSTETNHPLENIVIINTSPKSRNKTLFSNSPDAFDWQNNSCFSSHSSSGGTSSDGVAPMASPEIISPAESSIPSPRTQGCGRLSQDLYHISEYKDSFLPESNIPSPLVMEYTAPQVKFKLLQEGDIQVCYLNHTRTIISKVLSSKFLRRWETHHIYLMDDYICSKTPTGFLESPVPYSNIDEVYVVGRWDQGNRFCIRLVMAEGSLLLQTSNSLVRDQWLSSILWKKNMHKYRNILQTSKRPEVILKEIKGLIFSSLNSPLQDDCIINVPIEIISKVLDEEEIWNDRSRTEEVIASLAPLLEDSTPSPEMFQFFSRHCLSHPRSPVVVDIFTTIIHRILKRTVDFGKSPLMRRFVADYFKALHSQNDGDKAIRKFIASIHGTSCGCPHPRVLPNLVAVSLAAVFSHFEQRKTLLTESTNDANCAQAVQLWDKQLECFITLFLTISEFEDWRPGLAQLLQPIPFPDDALSHEAFIKGFTPVIRQIGMDPRCEVHEMVLGIRENKEGWLNVFCPSSLVCKDEGVLWCQMLQMLFHCCCRRKSFLQKMVKHLGALLLVALRNHAVAQDILCLMLEWRLIAGEDQELQVVTTLQSTESGRQKYSELCKRQEHLRELQKEGGPKKLTLPSRSTDADVARLLSCGSFGNLECLSLAFTHVTSACAHQLIKLPALRYLNLWATQFGDSGLILIAEHLDKLQVLNLCETPVSDKGIAAIAVMRNLKKLNLNSTKLSPQTLDMLKQKLPTLQELDVRYTDAW